MTASFIIVILIVAAVMAVVAIGVAVALFVIGTGEEKKEEKKEEEKKEEDRKRTETEVDDFVLPSSLKTVSPPKTTTLESTFNGKKIVVQAHSRLAGAIWSFAVGGKPYVTELYGNGGSLQYACFANVDNPDSSKKAHSESYNPTQGGNARDKNGATTSRWFDLSVDKDATMVFSKTQMAYYTDPANPHANARDGGLVDVFNTKPLSDFVLDQFLHLGYRGEPNVLLARYVLNVPEKLTDHKHADKVTFLIAEMPTGYMHADFTRHLRWNVGAKTFEALPGDTGSNVDSRPELGGAVATPDGKHCMGVWCVKSLPRRVNVPRFSVSEAGDGPNPAYQSIRLNKWALTTALGGERRHFHGPITTEVLLVVGSLAEVTETFKKLGL
jgi:hypothetical protein